jgi:hypothetical protein
MYSCTRAGYTTTMHKPPRVPEVWIYQKWRRRTYIIGHCRLVLPLGSGHKCTLHPTKEPLPTGRSTQAYADLLGAMSILCSAFQNHVLNSDHGWNVLKYASYHQF